MLSNGRNFASPASPASAAEQFATGLERQPRGRPITPPPALCLTWENAPELAAAAIVQPWFPPLSEPLRKVLRIPQEYALAQPPPVVHAFRAFIPQAIARALDVRLTCQRSAALPLLTGPIAPSPCVGRQLFVQSQGSPAFQPVAASP